jgi:formate hydrogenlyase subunit 4
MMVTRWSIGALQVVLLIIGSPLLVGAIRKVRARLEGRRGAPVVQPLLDIWKLLGKERMAPEHSSWVFSAAPLVVLGTAVVVGAIGPFVSTRSPVPQAADIFVVVSLVLLGTVALAAAGLDPGTAFGGMGASREMTVAALAEPTLLVAAFALAAPAKSTNLEAMITATLRQPGGVVAAATVLAFVAMAIAILAEGGRLPVDNPSTHLELTMIHEAMVLEYAGPDLAMVELGASARLAIFLALLANLFVPWGIATSTAPSAIAIGTLVLVGKVCVLGGALGVFEVFTAKLRLFRVPELLALSLVLAFLSVTAASFLS